MMNNRDKFEQDLTTLMSRLTIDVEKEVENKLNMLKDWLLNLQRANVVKINHSVMELVCAKHLILKGYEVQLEYPLNEILTCDLYSIKGYGNLIVEIETGFIPPEYALNPLTYRKICAGYAASLCLAFSTRLSQAAKKENR
jgi:biotin-(acetyl-CoA carboxylase) ligase